MQNAHPIEWIAAASAATLQPAASSAWTRALVCSLRDGALAPLLKPEPLAGDLADKDRPGASERSFFLARRAALRSLVARSTGVDAGDVAIRYDAPGAPRVLSASRVYVSVSSRGEIAALAVSSHPVGIDIEPLTQDVEVIADVLHANERAALGAMTPDEARNAFLRIWTAKEAWLKAKGEGLLQDPATLCAPWSGAGISQMLDNGSPNKSLAGEWREVRMCGQDIVAACVALPI